MKILYSAFLMLGVAVLLSGCSNSGNLTDTEMAKLDPDLRSLINNESVAESRYQTSQAENEITLYAVIISVNDPQVLTRAGIRHDAFVAGFATARLSKSDIKKAARIADVTSIRNPDISTPNGEQPDIIEIQ